MRLRRLIARRWFVLLMLIVVVSLFASWAFRPGMARVWLGPDGIADDKPLLIMKQWASGALGPVTPAGFLLAFPAQDLLLPASLLTAIIVLVIMLSAPSRDGSSRFWPGGSIGQLRLPRIRVRVRTMLVLIAIMGLELGWEIVAWRTWRHRALYLDLAFQHAKAEAWSNQSLHTSKIQLAALAAGKTWWPEGDMTTAARAADRAYRRDRLLGEIAYESAVVRATGELTRRYRAAAGDPRRTVTPDQPPPERPLDPDDWLERKEYGRALVGYAELIERYPDLARAHIGRAEILATCPDARIRNGKRAVASAIRACELTNWHDARALAALAAAHAEAGDFAAAIAWEQKAQQSQGAGRQTGTERHQQRMSLYKTGQPYHDRR